MSFEAPNTWDNLPWIISRYREIARRRQLTEQERNAAERAVCLLSAIQKQERPK